MKTALQHITEFSQRCLLCENELILVGKSPFCQWILDCLDLELDGMVTSPFRLHCRWEHRLYREVCRDCYSRGPRNNIMNTIKSREIHGKCNRFQKRTQKLSTIIEHLCSFKLGDQAWLHGLYHEFFELSGYTFRSFCDVQYTIRFLMKQKETRTIEDYHMFYRAALRFRYQLDNSWRPVYNRWDIVAFHKNDEPSMVYVY